MQLAYSLAQPASIPGLLAHIEDNSVESYAAEVAIPFGASLVQGTAVDQVKLPTLAGVSTEVFLGAAVHTHAYTQADTPVGYAVARMVNVLRRGKIWVNVSSAVTANDIAYADHTVTPGQFTDVVTTNGSAVGVFRSTQTTPGGLALLDLNLP